MDSNKIYVTNIVEAAARFEAPVRRYLWEILKRDEQSPTRLRSWPLTFENMVSHSGAAVRMVPWIAGLFKSVGSTWRRHKGESRFNGTHRPTLGLLATYPSTIFGPVFVLLPSLATEWGVVSLRISETYCAMITFIRGNVKDWMALNVVSCHTRKIPEGVQHPSRSCGRMLWLDNKYQTDGLRTQAPLPEYFQRIEERRAQHRLTQRPPAPTGLGLGAGQG